MIMCTLYNITYHIRIKLCTFKIQNSIDLKSNDLVTLTYNYDIFEYLSLAHH